MTSRMPEQQIARDQRSVGERLVQPRQHLRYVGAGLGEGQVIGNMPRAVVHGDPRGMRPFIEGRFVERDRGGLDRLTGLCGGERRDGGGTDATAEQDAIRHVCRRRRVIAKAEWTQNEANPRFIVTSLSQAEAEARHLYEKVYCARGEMENRIKEQQLDLFADRTSAKTMRANQLRLWFASMAYVLICALRRIGLQHTRFARATCGTIRLALLKIGALVRVSHRRIKIAMARPPRADEPDGAQAT